MEFSITDNISSLRTRIPEPVQDDSLETSLLNAVIEIWKEHWRIQALIVKSRSKDKLMIYGPCRI